VVTRLLHPPVQHEEEEEEMTTHRAGPKGEAGRGGSGSGAGVAANRFFGFGRGRQQKPYSSSTAAPTGVVPLLDALMEQFSPISLAPFRGNPRSGLSEWRWQG
jgi:hypothetical protein